MSSNIIDSIFTIFIWPYINIHLMRIQIILWFSSLGLQIAHSMSHIIFLPISFKIRVRTSISENKFQEIPMAISYKIKNGIPYLKYSSPRNVFSATQFSRISREVLPCQPFSISASSLGMKSELISFPLCGVNKRNLLWYNEKPAYD
jgi:hypothetical protein